MRLGTIRCSFDGCDELSACAELLTSSSNTKKRRGRQKGAPSAKVGGTTVREEVARATTAGSSLRRRGGGYYCRAHLPLEGPVGTRGAEGDPPTRLDQGWLANSQSS